MHLTITHRMLKNEEISSGLSILHDAYDWLQLRGIRQWTTPLEADIYYAWQERNFNYGTFVNDELVAVFSLVEDALTGWTDIHEKENALWLHALAVDKHWKHHNIGANSVHYAQRFADSSHQDLYLMCALGTGFLKSYYQSLSFNAIAQQRFTYPPYGVFEMTLMRHRKKTVEKDWATP